METTELTILFISELFSKLTPQEQDIIIYLIKSLLSRG